MNSSLHRISQPVLSMYPVSQPQPAPDIHSKHQASSSDDPYGNISFLLCAFSMYLPHLPTEKLSQAKPLFSETVYPDLLSLHNTEVCPTQYLQHSVPASYTSGCLYMSSETFSLHPDLLSIVLHPVWLYPLTDNDPFL